jgi:AcrR family transcriptional regulator
MGDVHDRVVAGTLRCIARWGVAKTTLDDIAREAGCSRATIYRAFPGGKGAVMLATGEAEVERLLVDLAIVLDAAESLPDLLVLAMAESIRAIRAHEALQYLMVHEPEHLLVHVSFDALDPLLALASDFGAPYLERYVDARTAREGAEWIARLIVSSVIGPCPIDFGDPDVASEFLATYVLPGLTSPSLTASVA